MLYNIYAGLGGGFGGAQYEYTRDCKDKEEADTLAYEDAISIYESYEGSQGILSYDDCRDVSDSDEEAEEMYQEEIENWIEYYTIPTDEDSETSKEEIWVLK